MLNKPISELGLASWLALGIVFMLLMFDRDFGVIYIAILVTALFFFLRDMWHGDRRISFPVERTPSGRAMDLVIAAGAYALFLVVTSFITKIFSPASMTGSLLEVIKTMSTDMYQASKPVLADSIILMVIGWGVFIPMAETWLFNGKLFEAIYDKVQKKSILTIVLICMIVGAFAALYHLSSKSGDSVALMITFVFFTLSGLLVWWRKDLRAAILLHMIANTIAVGFPLIS